MTQYQAAKPPGKPWKTWQKVIVITFFTLTGILCCGGIFSKAFEAHDAQGVATPTVAEAGQASADVVQSVAPAPKAATKSTTKPKPAPVTIKGDDIVHVGEDAPAGTYRAATAVDPGANCYWMKSSDAEGENIIDNDLPSGGRPQVTLKAGQWFTSSGCPTWVKK